MLHGDGRAHQPTANVRHSAQEVLLYPRCKQRVYFRQKLFRTWAQRRLAKVEKKIAALHRQ